MMRRHLPILAAALLMAGQPAAAQEVQALDIAPTMPLTEAEMDQPVWTGAMPTLLAGLADVMEESGRALQQGRRADGARALNRAWHAARLTVQAARGGPFLEVARSGLEGVRQGRIQLQNGNPALAAETLMGDAHVIVRMLDVDEDVTVALNEPDQTVILEERIGDTVLNATGRRLGEIESFATGEQGQDVAILRVGGVVDFAGFLSWGGQRVGVPREALVFGDEGAALASFITPEEMLRAAGEALTGAGIAAGD